MELINIENTISLSIRLLLDLLIAIIIIFLAVKPGSHKKTFIFTLILFNIVIFILSNLLNNSYLSMGSGLGLFALFTMMRYRSETLRLKELTYLFVLISIGFINAIGEAISIIELIILNATITSIIFCLERSGICKTTESKKIKYDNLELIRPEFKALLLFDIYKKTGIRARDLEIDSISFPDNTANIILYYDGDPEKQNGKTGKIRDIRNDKGKPEQKAATSAPGRLKIHNNLFEK